LTLIEAKIITFYLPDLLLVLGALDCRVLPIGGTKTQHFFSTEEKTEKRRKKKECLSDNEVEGGCQGLLKKNTTRSDSVGVEIFFGSNP